MAAAMCLPGSPRAINATVDGSRLVLAVNKQAKAEHNINVSPAFINAKPKAKAFSPFYAKQTEMGIRNNF